MDTSLLVIPTIVVIPIAGTGSGSIPAIVTIVNDHNDRHISQDALFYADFDFAPKK